MVYTLSHTLTHSLTLSLSHACVLSCAVVLSQMAASVMGQTQVVRTLLEHGALTQLEDKSGRTGIYECISVIYTYMNYVCTCKCARVNMWMCV